MSLIAEYDAGKFETWLAMESAPKHTDWVELQLRDGTTVEGHWASDLSGEFEPAFQGWFRGLTYKSREGPFLQVSPIRWRPLK